MDYSHIFEIISSNDLDQLKELVNEDAVYEARDERGFTLLHVASFLRKEILEYLLSTYTCPVNERCYEGRTPFFYACESQSEKLDLSTLEILIKHGADINIPNKEGLTPLHLTCRNGQFILTKLLTQNKVKLTTNEKNGYNVFHYIALSNCINCFNILLNYDKDNLKYILNNIDFDGSTALMLAADVANLEIAKELVTFGADCNTVGRNVTALHLAVVSQIPELFLLIWEQTNFEIIVKLKDINNLVKLMIKYGWFHPERVHTFFVVLSHPRILEVLTENAKILTVFFYRIRFVKNVHEIDVLKIIKKFSNVGLQVSQNDLRIFFLNFYKFDNNFEILNILIQYGGNVDEQDIIEFIIEIYPHLMQKLLLYCVKNSPVDVIIYFTKILRINKDMIKLIILMLHFCTVNRHLKLKLKDHLTNFCFAIFNNGQGDTDLLILYEYILQCLKSQNVPSLTELSRDVLRKRLAEICSNSKEYLAAISKLELPIDIVNIIQCKCPVNIFSNVF